MKPARHNLLEYLCSCRELLVFCTQGGCIDTSSLEFRIVENEAHSALVEIEFDEIVARGPGNIAARVPCFGRMRLFFDEIGTVQSARVA